MHRHLLCRELVISRFVFISMKYSLFIYAFPRLFDEEGANYKKKRCKYFFREGGLVMIQFFAFCK